MKVLCVINRLITGGAEKLILDSAPLIQRKVDFDILLLTAQDYPFEGLLKKSFVGKIFVSRWKNVYNPLHVFSILPYLKKYDIVHVHLFPAFYWVVFAKILAFSKTKIVYTEHSTSNRRMRNPLFKFFDRVVYSKIKKVITISDKVDQAIKKYLRQNHTKFCLIPNGVNLAQIQQALPLPKEHITGVANDQRAIVMQVSSFQHPKDHVTIIDALQHLPDSILAVFVGGGPDRAKVEKYVNQKSLSHRVVFLGVRTDVPRLLKTADVVVLSSHYEGLSLASIEGMASGRPFVASDVPGLHEVVKGAGLLFDNKNHHQLARHVTELMANKDYYNQVAAKCQERARRYDIQTMVNKQVELYKHLCPPKTDEKKK